MFPDTGEYRECPYVNMTTGAGYIHWYGLKVFFNKVFEIESLLSADGVESYIPCEMVTVEVRGIWKQVRRTVIPSLMFFRSTEEYAKELGNKEKEDAAIKAMKEAPDGGQIRCMVLTAENNAKVMMDCIKELIRAVDILRNPEEDVDEWMLSGIMAMLDRVNQLKYIPFDLPASICGLLCAEDR